MPTRDIALALTVVLIWGFNVVVIKSGLGQLPPFLLTTLRFALVAVLIVPFFHLKRERLPQVLVLSFTFGTLHFAMLFAGMEGMDGSTAGVLIQLGVPLATLLAAIFLKEHVGPWRIAGLATAFVGAGVLAGEPSLPDVTPFLLIVTSAFGWALSNLLVKKVPDVHPLTLTGWIALFAIPQAAFASWLFEADHMAVLAQADWRGWFAVAYTAIASSIVAYAIWYALLHRHPMPVVVPFGLLTPLVAVTASVLILDEVLNWQKVVGGVLTVGGVGVILWRQGLRKRPEPPVSEPPGVS